MLTMKMAVLAGGAFVFACVCGASALVDFDSMPTVEMASIPGCIGDGWLYPCNSPEADAGEEVATSWRCKYLPVSGCNQETTKPVDDGQEVAMPTYEECMIEWTDDCGETVRMHIQGAGLSELTALAGVFRSGRA